MSRQRTEEHREELPAEEEQRLEKGLTFTNLRGTSSGKRANPGALASGVRRALCSEGAVARDAGAGVDTLMQAKPME